MVLALARELLLVSCSSCCAVPISVLFPAPVVLLAAITPVPPERTIAIAIPIKIILRFTHLSILIVLKDYRGEDKFLLKETIRPCFMIGDILMWISRLADRYRRKNFFQINCFKTNVVFL